MTQAILASVDEPLEAKWDPHWMRLVVVRRRSVVILTIEDSRTYSIIQHVRREDIFPRGAKILVGSPPIAEVRTLRNNPAATLHLGAGGKAAFRWWRTKAGIQAGSQSDSVKFMQGDSQKLTRLASESIEIQPPGICWWDISFLHPLRGWESAGAHPDVPVCLRGKNGLNPWNLFPVEGPKPALVRTSFVPLSGYASLERYPLVMAVLHTGEGRWWRGVRRHERLLSGTSTAPFGTWHTVWDMPAALSQIDLKIHPLGLGAWAHTAQELQWFSPSMQSLGRAINTEFVSWTRLGGLVYRNGLGQVILATWTVPGSYSHCFGSVFWAGESAFGHLLEITKEGRINCVAGETLTCRSNEIDPDGVGMPV